jgi:hypothetical protein
LGIVTEWSPGWIALVVLAGSAYAFWLYFVDIRRNSGKRWLLWLMFALRFLFVTIIAFLLLSPMIRMKEKVVEKPLVIIGADNTESIRMIADSSFYRTKWPAMLDDLRKKLASKADVQVFSVGEKVTDGFDASYRGQRTDISDFFREIQTRFANRNVAAVILASDGIYNHGTDPYYSSRGVTTPVYTVKLGDTTLRKDLILKKVISNKVAFKNDRFPVELLVEMNKCSQQKSGITISRAREPIIKREISTVLERSVQRYTFWLDANQPGINRYRIEISPIDGEANYENNIAELIVDVRDARQKVAIIYNAPHPDLMAIEHALTSSSHFETEMITNPGTMDNWNKYDLVILHQIPSITSVRDVKSLMNSKVSLLFILGAQSDINSFNALKTGLTINAGKNSMFDSEPVLNQDFSLFTVTRQEFQIMEDYPPLFSPFGTYQYSPLSDVLVYQKIAGVTTKNPLVLFSKAGEKKVGIIAGENIWRWRMDNYIRNSGFDGFDQLIDKMAIYLSTREDKNFLRIRIKNKFSEIEPVELEAELFNKSYERITTPDVNLTIFDSEKRSYPFIFSKGDPVYYLKAGVFPAGDYTFTASARVGNEIFQQTGQFFVSEVNAEAVSLIADHQILTRIALSHDGQAVSPDSLGQLADIILKRDEMKSISSSLLNYSDLIAAPWLFLFLLLLITAEWMIRKREGKY